MKEWQLGNKPIKEIRESVKYPTPCTNDTKKYTKIYCEKHSCKFNSACCLTHSVTELCICQKDNTRLYMNAVSGFTCADYVYESKAARCSACREHDLVESLKEFMEENTLTFETLEVLIETTKAYEGEL